MDAIRTRYTIRRGFTLAEMVVSAVIMSILAVGISSAVLVSVRAVETQDSQVLRTLGAADVSNQMSMEMASAVDFTEAAPNAVTFDVPDRYGDGTTETIRYSWSGVAGDPLTRQVNGGTATTLAENIYQLNFNYLTKTLNP